MASNIKRIGKVLYTSGDWENVVPNNGRSFSLKELQKHVGGNIERVHITGETKISDFDKRTMTVYCNEEGRLNSTLNHGASLLLGQELYGPILIVAPEQISK